jgi:hypothetical protein
MLRKERFEQTARIEEANQHIQKVCEEFRGILLSKSIELRIIIRHQCFELLWISYWIRLNPEISQQRSEQASKLSLMRQLIRKINVTQKSKRDKMVCKYE